MRAISFFIRTNGNNMENASVFLLSFCIACPTKNSAVIHFIDGPVSEDTLRMAGRILISSLWHIHHFLGVVKCPSEIVGRRICFYFANDLSVFMSCYAINPLLAWHANRLICKLQKKNYFLMICIANQIFMLFQRENHL